MTYFSYRRLIKISLLALVFLSQSCAASDEIPNKLLVATESATNESLLKNSVYQIAFVVEDLDAAAEHWVSMGAGPFYQFYDFEFSEIHVPAGGESPRLDILMGYSGNVLIELMKAQHDPQGLFSTPGPHHVARLVSDIDTYNAKAGVDDSSIALRGVFSVGIPAAFIDTREELGLFTELITHGDPVSGLLAQMHAEAQAFDGQNPIRQFGAESESN